MKSRFLWKWSLGACLTVLPFAGGCLRAGTEAATNAAPVEAAQAAAGTNVSEQAALAGATNASVVDISEAEVRPIEEEKPLPTNVRTSGPAGELLKLAASGVEENVILAYITNSPSIFTLSADEIIYLKDLGISSDVIASSMHRDQVLKSSGAVPVEQAQAAVSETNTAPAAVPDANSGPTSNWINSDTQPDPSQVAPQANSPAPPAETQPVPAPAPQTEVTYSTFYGSLSPYGTWLEVDGYGRVWQPTVVAANSGWSPYFDGGRWIYTDRGWYWASDYSWGWAPFHYGRWFRHHRIGWCWMPDLVWGPSWVTWRYNDAYCGWAPLPPAAYYRSGFGFTYYGSAVGASFGFGLGYHHYSFVAWNYFPYHNRRYHHHGGNHLHAVPLERRREIYNNTKVVTKIVGNNNTVINEGVSRERVAAATGTPIKPVAIRESRSTARSTQIGRAGLDPAGKTLTVYKPETPRGERAGGIPMERVRTGLTRSTGGSTGTIPTADAGSTQQRTRSVRDATVRSGQAATPKREATPRTQVSRPSRSETRTATTSVAPSTPATTAQPIEGPKVEPNPGNRTGRSPEATRPGRPVTGRTEAPKFATDTPKENSSGSVVATPQSVGREGTQPKTSSPSIAERTVPKQTSPTASFRKAPAVTAPKAAEAPAMAERPSPPPSTTPAPSTASRQPSVWSSPRTANTPSRAERVERPATPAPSAPPASASAPGPSSRPSSAWASPRASQTPSRIERSPSAGPRADLSSPAPSLSTPAAPSSPSLGQYSAPTGQRSYTAPTGQRPYSPPTVQRSYTAPSAGRDYSAPSGQRQYTAPSAQRPYSAPSSSYSAPSAPQRQYSAPAPSVPSRSYSVPSAPTRPAPSYSAPSRPSSPSPSPSSSPGRGGGSSRGRGDR